MAFRLKSLHPLTKKMDLLERFLTDNKISLEFTSYYTALKDEETGMEVHIKDVDNNTPVCEFPAQFEYKLIISED